MRAPRPDDAEPQLATAIAQLRDDDPLVRNDGVLAAANLGSAAVPHLRRLLDEAPETGSFAMDALARIADPQAADVFLRGLESDDEWVRAHAAMGLARIGHRDALDASLRTLGDAPDELHQDSTPAVRTLGDMGLRAVEPLLARLLDDDRMVRLLACRALERIVDRAYGFTPGQGFATPEDEERARRAWEANGEYDDDAPLERRAHAVKLWRRWLAEQRGAP